MKKTTIGTIGILSLLLLVGAGCGSSNEVYVADTDTVGSLTEAGGDASEVETVEEDTGLNLPTDAAVTLRLGNEENYTVSYNSGLSVDEMRGFYEAELEGNGFTAKRPWTEFAAGEFSTTSGLYESTAEVVNVSIAESESGTSVSLQIEQQ